MAISKDKIVGYKLSTKHGNAKDFTEFIKSLNVSHTTLLMDNVAFHKTKLLKDYVHSTNNTILYTPPYSPQYNPIELAFSKIKSTYRKLNFIQDTLEDNILTSINSITLSDLKAFYRHVRRICEKN
jgi:transposase